MDLSVDDEIERCFNAVMSETEWGITRDSTEVEVEDNTVDE